MNTMNAWLDTLRRYLKSPEFDARKHGVIEQAKRLQVLLEKSYPLEFLAPLLLRLYLVSGPGVLDGGHQKVREL